MKRSIPLVVRLSTSSAEASAIDGDASTRIEKWNCKREYFQARKANLLITHSDAHRKLMAEELKVPYEQIQVVPLGIENKRRTLSQDLINSVPTIVFVGRLEHRKGTVDLLRAVPLVLKHVSDAQFVFIGKDRPHCPGDRTHSQFIQDELPPAVASHITLKGRLSDEEVDHWMQAATVFVAPSLYESFGLVFLEAMRWGAPVIGTCVGGVPEIVQNNRSGVLVPPSNPAALAEALINMLQNPQRREAIGAAGKKRFEERFTVERMAQQTATLYDQEIRKWKKM